MYLMKTKSSQRTAVDQQAAQILGWASLAVGLTEILASEPIRKAMGVGETSPQSKKKVHGILRVLGVREIMHGIDILAHKDPTPGVWSRVLGDLLDGVVLGAAATRTKKPEGFLGICAAVTPLVVADLIFAPRLTNDKVAGEIDG